MAKNYTFKIKWLRKFSMQKYKQFYNYHLKLKKLISTRYFWGNKSAKKMKKDFLSNFKNFEKKKSIYNHANNISNSYISNWHKKPKYLF